MTESPLAVRMKISRYLAVLDTSVLAPMPIADTLLRLAEEPSFYTPKWSQRILDKLHRTLKKRFQYPEEKVVRRISLMNAAFPDAIVAGHEGLIGSMTNDPKDRQC